MRSYSLSFYCADYERAFAKENMENNLKALRGNLFLFGCSGLSIILFSFFTGLWQLGIVSSLLTIPIPFIYLVARISPKYFDFSCFAFQTLINFCAPLAYLMNIVNGPIIDSQTYLIGQAVSQIVQSSNLGSRYYLKVLTVLLNGLLQFVIKLFLQKQVTALCFLWLASNFIILHYVYWQDRIKKEAFLVKNQHTIWESEIGSCANISIINCLSDKGKLLLDYEKCNQRSKDLFQITSINTLKFFLNGMKLIQKNLILTEVKNCQKQFKRQKKTTSLHSFINQYSQQIQTSKCEFIGLYNSHIYDIKIFTSWNEKLLNIHTLINRKFMDPDNYNESVLQYERKVFSNFRNKCAEQMKIICYKLKSLDQTKGQPILNIAYESLRQNYNLKLYLNPQHLLTHTSFLLWPLMMQINQMVRDNMPSPLKLQIIYIMDQKLKLYSCQKTIYHILFNLFQIITLCAKKSGILRVSVQEGQDETGPLITISIATNITSIRLIKEGQNFKRNNYGWEKQSDYKKVGLEVIVSEYLIGKIGPQRHIKMVDKLNSIFLSFIIYQNLAVLSI